MLCGWRWRSLAIPWLGMRNHDLGFPEALAQVVRESGGPWEFHWCYSLSEARLGAQITIILIYSSLKFNLFKQNLSLNGVYCVRQMSAFYLMRRIYLWLSRISLNLAFQNTHHLSKNDYFEKNTADKKAWDRARHYDSVGEWKINYEGRRIHHHRLRINIHAVK